MSAPALPGTPRSMSPPARPAPSGPRLLGRQAAHDLVGIARTPVVLFFALAFPTAFFVVLASLVGNAVVDFRGGVRLAQFLAPAFASFGVAMATLAFLAIGLAEIRWNGVLRRLRGTPLPVWVLLGGRVVAGTALAVASVALLVGIGVLAFHVQIVWRTVPAVVVTVLVAAMAFSAIGLAIAAWAPSMQAATAIANAFVISLAFVSDLFVVGTIPGWLGTVGWWFPLKHLVNALGDAFNPYLTGSGLAPGHLAALAAWGVAGAVVAWLGLRRMDAETRGPGRVSAGTGAGGGTAAGGTAAGGAVAGRGAGAGATADSRPRRAGRPGPWPLTLDQVRHADAAQWRDWSAVFFGVAFPVLLVALLTTVFGGKDARTADGVALAPTLAAGLSVYGAAVIAFVNLPQGLAGLRATGVLRRWQGTPLPPYALLVGRAASAVWLALIATGLVYALAVPLFGVTVPGTWPWAVLVLVVSAASFAALGIAVVTFVRGTQGVLAVSLGTVVTLSFFSDIFVFGVAFPGWLDALSWALPLRNAVHAFGAAMGVGPGAPGFDAGHLAVVAAWGLAGAAVAFGRFRVDR